MTYPLAGWLGTLAGFTVTWTVLGVLAAAATLSVLWLWPQDLPDLLRHAHDDAAAEHVHDAEWDGSRWLHSHRIVIDSDHARWPSAV